MYVYVCIICGSVNIRRLNSKYQTSATSKYISLCGLRVIFNPPPNRIFCIIRIICCVFYRIGSTTHLQQPNVVYMSRTNICELVHISIPVHKSLYLVRRKEDSVPFCSFQRASCWWWYYFFFSLLGELIGRWMSCVCVCVCRHHRGQYMVVPIVQIYGMRQQSPSKFITSTRIGTVVEN